MAAKKTPQKDKHLQTTRSIRASDEQWEMWRKRADVERRNLNDLIRVVMDDFCAGRLVPRPSKKST